MALRHRGTPFSVTLAAATTLCVLPPTAPAEPRPPRADSTVLASIQVHNPTAWDGALPVEVPIGRLATPGLIDWPRVRLVGEDGRDVPFAIREGRPHWKARLVCPAADPRAEDILVFASRPAPGTWARIDVVAGEPLEARAVSEHGGRIVVSYPYVRATIDRSSGMLLRLEASGESLLESPMEVSFRRTSADGPREDLGPPRVELASMSSGPAVTELHFVLSSARLALAVTYRIHASGAVEILSDGRPWEGASPWVDGLVEIALPLSGAAEELPFLVNRAPYYGFKDFAAAVRHVAVVRRGPRATVLELGAENVNGRRWSRRLYPVRSEQTGRLSDLVEMVDEGPIVDVSPRTLAVPTAEAVIVHPPEARVAAEILTRALAAHGVAATAVAAVGEPPAATFVLRLSGPMEAPGIEGDGFEIRPAPRGEGISIVAHTLAGLVAAAHRAAERIERSGESIEVPLIAGNPAAAWRGAGFGGGDFEVDFPYGSEAEWREVLDALAASGMNAMADLGMWSNWKMPITFRGMPELLGDSPGAYDEVSGARLSEIASHRERGLRLLGFLHDRGVKVWLWLPTGCVPTTYAERHPEAMSPGDRRFPCLTHPLYHRFLEGFLKELLETYPIDGIVMIRDDNGGLCSCERCKASAAASPTRSVAWDGYLLLHGKLRSMGFRGTVAVYPYFDLYEARLDPLLPRDLLVVGHGSGAALLARDYEAVAPMGDTWLDNAFAGFRVPTAARMRRLLADWSSFWLGGAYRGSELAWEAIGRFGWEPTGTVNTLRYEWGGRRFGDDRALDFVRLADAYEDLQEIWDLPMLPHEWVKLGADARRETASRGRNTLGAFRERLEAIRSAAGLPDGDAWILQARLFGDYVEYHLRRLEILSELEALCAASRSALDAPEGAPAPVRERLLALDAAVYAMAEEIERRMASVPGAMLARTRAMGLMRPHREFVNGYDPSLDALLETRQFAGDLDASPAEVRAGEPFVLRIRMRNEGLGAWRPGAGLRLELGGDAKLLGLPERWEYEGPPLVFGDRRELELLGAAPREPGEGLVRLVFRAPFRSPFALAERRWKARWR